MFGLGFSELILLAVIALVFIGPEQLPEVARTFARLLNEWKRATSDLKTNLLKDEPFDQRHTPAQTIAPPQPPSSPPPAAPEQEKKESES